MLAEDLLPVYDVHDEVATVVAADPATTWAALMECDLIEVGRRRPLVGALGAMRALPQIAADLLHGERPEGPPDRLTLRDTTRLPVADGGWILLGEVPGAELALGLVGRFWRPVIEYAHLEPEAFAGFDEPGYAKTIYALGVRPVAPDRTLLWGQMRTATTDEHARRWFRRYWTLGVGSGAHVLVQGVLDVTREDAEARQPADALSPDQQEDSST
ncbi:MAG TPA: hypothetical protein PKD63_07610 [Solirubrobacteraceae bacterium]|nr:hypothetical protein [Solirubrobacteraceae bacterium]